jgi:hypothetical protein
MDDYLKLMAVNLKFLLVSPCMLKRLKERKRRYFLSEVPVFFFWNNVAL